MHIDINDVCVCVCVYIYIYIYIYTHTHTQFQKIRCNQKLLHISDRTYVSKLDLGDSFLPIQSWSDDQTGEELTVTRHC